MSAAPLAPLLLPPEWQVRVYRFGHEPEEDARIKTLAVVLIAVMLAGCANVVHPAFPGQTFSSVEQCERYAFQQGQDQFQCGKVMNAQATNDAVATGLLAGLVVFLGVLIGLSAAHGGR